MSKRQKKKKGLRLRDGEGRGRAQKRRREVCLFWGIIKKRWLRFNHVIKGNDGLETYEVLYLVNHYMLFFYVTM